MAEVVRLERSVAGLRDVGAADARLVIVLGSGLKRFGEQVDDAREISFGDVPEWPVPRVEGHGGSLLLGRVEGLEVACLTGRVHAYEGWSPAEVVRPVRALRLCGVRRFLLTNAAGGTQDDMRAGDLMVISDHINGTGMSPLVGEHEHSLGPRFPDQSAVWSERLTQWLHDSDPAMHRGTYVGLLGPGYETPAEVQMWRGVGASAIGMSTVLEAVALNAMGAELAGVSLISNLAAGMSSTPLSHEEVIAAGASAEKRLTRLVRAFCARCAKHPAED